MLGDAVLLADDGMLRVLLLDAATDELLGRAVGGCDRGVVRLHVGADAGLKVAKGQPSGQIGRFDGEVQVGLQRWGHRILR